jgi:hypothetical protein
MITDVNYYENGSTWICEMDIITWICEIRVDISLEAIETAHTWINQVMSALEKKNWFKSCKIKSCTTAQTAANFFCVLLKTAKAMTRQSRHYYYDTDGKLRACKQSTCTKINKQQTSKLWKQEGDHTKKGTRRHRTWCKMWLRIRLGLIRCFWMIRKHTWHAKEHALWSSTLDDHFSGWRADGHRYRKAVNLW